MRPSPQTLQVRRLGIHTHDEAVAYMRVDCHVCRAEGFAQHSRIQLENGGREIIVTLHHVSSNLVGLEEVGLSEIAWQRLNVSDGDTVAVSHPKPVESLASVRRRIYGHRLEAGVFLPIMRDVVDGRYSDVQLASLITACAALPLDLDETVALTRAMVDVGEQLAWKGSPILDKHSVGGLPGNRTTPIVVAIVAAHGLTMPKTSSRAITSPAGTADTMETLAPVDLDLAAIRRVVEREGGCIVWGGAVRLSPADDVLIRVERALDVDSEGQLVASILSKKIAAGSSHVIIDMPVGSTAKVRSMDAAAALGSRLREVATACEMEARVLISDGSQPIGRGIGPALEAEDVLAVLQARPDARNNLKERACALAGTLLELAGKAEAGHGQHLAEETLANSQAWKKFQAICEAQGGMRIPPRASYHQPLVAPRAGRIKAIDNRKIARLAKLAGAPEAKASGVALDVQLGSVVAAGQPLCVLYAESRGELHYALDYAGANPDIIDVEAA
jgi:thymidine phosphorylase